MKTVKIYIETTMKGPGVRDGKYAAALIFERDEGDFTRTLTGEEKETTFNRSTLIAAIESLKRLNQKCHVIIYTDNAYVKNMVEQENPEKWRRAEWKKAVGKDVRNKELWKQFLEEKDKHEIEGRFSKYSIYQETLQAIMNGEEI